MRAVIALFIAVVVALASVSAYAAGPGAKVKSSPLFKRSLDETVAMLEGETASKEAAQGEAEATPTGVAECEEPLGPITSFGQPSCDDTCQPTGCGGECYTQMNTCTPSACGTCAFTCSGTCAGQPTCSATCPGWSTCASTCSGPTCGNTCESTCDQVCPWVEGDIGYCGNYGYWFNGWSNLSVKLYDQSMRLFRSDAFFISGYYKLESFNQSGWLTASGKINSQWPWFGDAIKPSQPNHIIWVYINIDEEL